MQYQSNVVLDTNVHFITRSDIQNVVLLGYCATASTPHFFMRLTHAFMSPSLNSIIANKTLNHTGQYNQALHPAHHPRINLLSPTKFFRILRKQAKPEISTKRTAKVTEHVGIIGARV